MDYLGKHALRGHNARAYLPEDRTFGMTFFAELGKLKDGLLSYREMSANGQGEQVYSLSCQILSKITGAHINSTISHLMNAFNRKQAYLPVG